MTATTTAPTVTYRDNYGTPTKDARTLAYSDGSELHLASDTYAGWSISYRPGPRGRWRGARWVTLAEAVDWSEHHLPPHALADLDEFLPPWARPGPHGCTCPGDCRCRRPVHLAPETPCGCTQHRGRSGT